MWHKVFRSERAKQIWWLVFLWGMLAFSVGIDVWGYFHPMVCKTPLRYVYYYREDIVDHGDGRGPQHELHRSRKEGPFCDGGWR